MKRFSKYHTWFSFFATLVVIVVSVAAGVWGWSTFGPQEQSTSPILPHFPTSVSVPQKEPMFPDAGVAGPELFQYITVTDGCGPYFEGECVNVRSGPGEEYPVVARLRTGVVLRVSKSELHNGREWYKIEFETGVRYPERIWSDWFVAADVVEVLHNGGDHSFELGTSTPTKKRIIVDRSEQVLYAYDDDNLFMKEPISTGLEFTPTPRGTFIVYRMTPSRYMQGPLPGVTNQYYDLPGVPWNLYFTLQGGVIHGAYWHDHFGERWSHGCVNLPPDKAKELYLWADIGTAVLVQD